MSSPLTLVFPDHVDTNRVYDLYYDHRLGTWTVSPIPNGKDINELMPF